MKQKYCIDDINTLHIEINKPTIIFLRGDLGAGKTTLSKHIINNILGVTESITSPTYTYYNKYKLPLSCKERGLGGEVYHFDLYRLGDYDEFFAIGAEEIFDNNEGIILVEWPELIADQYTPDIDIHLEKTDNEGERIITII